MTLSIVIITAIVIAISVLLPYFLSGKENSLEKELQTVRTVSSKTGTFLFMFFIFELLFALVDAMFVESLPNDKSRLIVFFCSYVSMIVGISLTAEKKSLAIGVTIAASVLVPICGFYFIEALVYYPYQLVGSCVVLAFFGLLFLLNKKHKESLRP